MREINKIIIHTSALIKSTDQDELNHFYENYWKLKTKHIDLLQGVTDELKICETLWYKIIGWRNPGYARFIKNDGSVKELRPFSAITNGVKGHNKDSIHIAYNGGVDRSSRNGRYIHVDNRTEDQKASILDCIRDAITYSNNREVEIHGHNYYNKNKACPCFDAEKEYEWITM